MGDEVLEASGGVLKQVEGRLQQMIHHHALLEGRSQLTSLVHQHSLFLHKLPCQTCLQLRVNAGRGCDLPDLRHSAHTHNPHQVQHFVDNSAVQQGSNEWKSSRRCPLSLGGIFWYET
jgi:hypothetical protein